MAERLQTPPARWQGPATTAPALGFPFPMEAGGGSGCTEHCSEYGHLHFELDDDGNRLEDPAITSAMIRDGATRPNPEAACHRCGYAMLDEPHPELTADGWQHPGCPWLT